MGVPRRFIVDESCSSTYHCISRTVRQAFLLAPDHEEADADEFSGAPSPSGRVDNHRRDWILERIRFQSQIFAVDCISLAVMSNHLHLLLRILPEVVESWSAFEVAHRWLLLRPQRAQREAMGVDLSLPPLESEVATVAGDARRIAELRGRLASPSWYMKELKEWTARRVNREENRTGAFWEERFRSFRVLDVEGLLRCALYIDLNPVAACMVDDPLLAKYTSVGEHARSALGPDDVRGRSRAGIGASEVAPADAESGRQTGGHASRAGECATMATRRAVRELWRRLLEAPRARGRHGAEPWQDGLSEVQLAEGMADFVASFDGMSFHPAVPARREPHHPCGMADDDESIAVIPVLHPVLQPIPQTIKQAESGQLDADAAGNPAAQAEAGSAEAIHSDAPQQHTVAGEPMPSGRSTTAPRSKPAAFRASIAPRQARHRRQPPDVAVLDMPLSEYLTQLRMVAELAHEHGIAQPQGEREDKRPGRLQGGARRRNREEIELALGREADGKGLATLLGALVGPTDSGDSSPGERRRLLVELVSGARLFGTAVGSKAALATEALRRGRSKVVMAFRPETRGRRNEKDGTGQGKDNSRAVPRAG